MSVHALRWAVEQNAGGPMPKLVLLVLADHANRDGRATTSVATLARETEASERTVRRALDALAERHLIARARRQRGTGADTSNVYRLTLDGPHEPVTVTPAPVGHSDTPDGQSDPRPRTQGHPRDVTASPHAGVTVTPQGEPEVLNRTTEPKSGAARARGTTTVAELSATAVRPDAYRLVSAWREQTGVAYRPATVRALAKIADGLLRDGADPTAVRAALDEWHRRPDARPGLLPHLYDDAVKAAHHNRNPPGRPAARSGRGDKVRGWLALADVDKHGHVEPGRLAVEGAR
ncbi:helix-turn-helix domain-containing protein [Actinokineospora iranica]|uniref:Helix-turn-helix domain-containing protein n=1 Tax=Actinokineospora iranica TaxID=1271860 RepID=A0A1G6Y737_9PSEU|nr:helix-turn-helix domain-containing protein [Actinokineospora iranica]SDD86218.1 Helix-turn-helix domain-containing protein [Actinokineospora iranica]